MGWEHLLAFNIALGAAILSPGPALILALRTTLSSGRAAGVATGFGLGTMAAIWTLAALLGLEALFLAAPWAYTGFKLFGAGFLIWTAWRIWRAADQTLSAPTRGEGRRRLARAYATGFLVNLGNPKSALFAASMLVVIFPPGLSTAEAVLIAANHLAFEWLFYAVFAGILATGPVSRRYLAAKPVIDRAAALILGALGLRLALD